MLNSVTVTLNKVKDSQKKKQRHTRAENNQNESEYTGCEKPSSLFQSINFRLAEQNPTTVNTYTDNTLLYI